MRLKQIVWCIPLLLAMSAQAANDLLADWRAASGHDPEYAAALADYSAGQAKAHQAKALWRPNIALGANLGWANQSSLTTGAAFGAPGFGTASDVDFRTKIEGGTAQGWSLILAQPLWSGERSAMTQALNVQTALAEAQLRAAKQALILRVAQAHLNLLLARESLKSAQAEQAATEHALSEARESFNAGAIPVTGVHEAQSRRDAVAAQVLAAQDALTMARADYVDLTGLPADDAAQMSDRAGTDANPGPLETWLQRAHEQNPQVAMSRLSVDLARAEARRHDAWSGARLDLVARAGEDRLRGDSPYATSGSAHYNTGAQWVGVQLNVPLYTGGMRSAQEEEAAALAEKALAQSQKAQIDLVRQTRAAWLAVTTGVAQVHALEQARFSAAQRLDATRTGLEVGDRTVLELLDAERDLHAADLGWRQARHAVLLGRLNLAATAGILDETALQDVNAAFASPASGVVGTKH